MENTSKSIIKMESTRYCGIYQRQSESRMHKAKPDMCFYMTYKVEGHKKWEKAGWLSEGFSAKLASQLRAEKLRTIRHGGDLPTKKKTPYFKDVAKSYIKWAKENQTRQGGDGISRYNTHLAPRFDSKRLDQISTFDLERMKSKLLEQGLAPATVAHCLKLFRQIFNKAIAWGMYKGDNPVKQIKMPVINNQRQRFLTVEESKVLLLKIKEVSPLLHDMALISLHCGLRAGEIFNLKMQDLDFQNGLIRIADPKNKESRVAYMTDTVRTALKACYHPETPEEYIFKDRWHGGQIQGVSASFRRIVKDIGFNKGVTDPRQLITFHSLRHTFASWLAMQGESLITLRDLLGHKTTAMTNRYAHLTPDHKKNAILSLEKMITEKLEMTGVKGK